MANWKNKQVAFDLDDEEESALFQFGKNILFTPIMKACLRLIKNGILKASFSKDGKIQITWHGEQSKISREHEDNITTQIQKSSQITHIAQNDANLYELAQHLEEGDQFIL